MGRFYRPSSEPEETKDPVYEVDSDATGRVYNTPSKDEETGAPDPDLPVIEHDGQPPLNPADHSAEVVNHYLATGSTDLEAEGDPVDQAEVDRVLAAEAAEDGKKRKSVLEGPFAPRA